MTRHEDWEERLHDFLVANNDRPFAWGEHDCILFACAAVNAMTGIDPADEYRGRYTDAKGAALALRELGQGTLVRTVDAVFPSRSVGKARRGDLVMSGTAIGVCVGDNALFVGEEHLAEAAGVPLRNGLISIPRSAWSLAWSVG